MPDRDQGSKLHSSNSSSIHLGGLRNVNSFRSYLAKLQIHIPCDDELISGDSSPLGQPLDKGGVRLGNRFAIQPMEGWDGTADGRPTELTFRRWKHFGDSGAKLIWGGEAVAVRHDGRANPNQLAINEHSKEDLSCASRDIDYAASTCHRLRPPICSLDFSSPTQVVIAARMLITVPSHKSSITIRFLIGD